MLLPASTQPVRNAEATASTRELSNLLRPNVEQSARVVSVRQDAQSPTLFRLTLELGSNRLEVMTNRPLMEGSNVLLTRNAQGDLQLRLPPVQNAPVGNNSAQQGGSPASQTFSFIAVVSPQSRAQVANLPLQQVLPGLVQPRLDGRNAPGLTSGSASTNSAALQGNSSTAAAAQSGAPGTTNATPGASAANTGAQVANPAANPAVGAAAASVAAAQTGNSAAVTVNPAGNRASSSAGTTGPGGTAQPLAPITPGGGTAAQNPVPQTSSNTGQAGSAANASGASSAGQTAQAATTSSQAGFTPSPTGVAGNATGASPPGTAAPIPSSNTGNALPSPGVAQAGTQASGTGQTGATNTGPTAASSQANANPGARTGQLMNQAVETIQPNRQPLPLDTVRVNVNGQPLELLSPRPLMPGQPVELVRINELQFEIRVRPPINSSLPSQVVEEMQQLLKTALPIQAPLADSLNQLRALPSAQQQDAVGQLVRSLMSLFSMEPKGNTDNQSKQVQQLINQSGLFTESNLAKRLNNGAGSVEDLRAKLGRLKRLAQELPTSAREQMLQLLQRAESRTTAQQFSSIQQWRDMPDGSAERFFRVDLPLLTARGFENVELKLKEHRPAEHELEKTTQWTLNLHFELETLGKVDARLHLQDEWTLTAKFWAERRDTTELIRDRLTGLDADLKNQGFEIESLLVQRGQAPADELPALYKNLVDLHT